MNSELTASSVCYGLYDDNDIIGFMAVLHQPHGKNKKIKRCSRLVILPDYQGIGLGTRFLTKIAELYKAQEFDFSIVTSAKNMIRSLSMSDKWAMVRYGTNKCSSTKSAIDYKRKSLRNNCKTASFFYKK